MTRPWQANARSPSLAPDRKPGPELQDEAAEESHHSVSKTGDPNNPTPQTKRHLSMPAAHTLSPHSYAPAAVAARNWSVHMSPQLVDRASKPGTKIQTILREAKCQLQHQLTPYQTGRLARPPSLVNSEEGYEKTPSPPPPKCDVDAFCRSLGEHFALTG
ncbi:hypothetical protein CRENBAI_009370, partial [Crenichthys baileyi]